MALGKSEGGGRCEGGEVVLRRLCGVWAALLPRGVHPEGNSRGMERGFLLNARRAGARNCNPLYSVCNKTWPIWDALLKRFKVVSFSNPQALVALDE